METYKLTAVAMLSALAGLLQLSNGVIGIPTGFGMTVDLVGVPAMLGFLLFGLDAALYISVLTALIITLIAPTTWLGASTKFAATLPMFLFPALYALSSKKKFDAVKVLMSTVLVALVALLVIVLSGNTNLTFGQLITETNQTIYMIPRVDVLKMEGGSVTLAGLLLGVLPIAAIALFSLVLLHFWRRYAKETDSRVFSDARLMLLVLIPSVLIRGVAMVIVNYYYAGPLFFKISTADFMQLVPWYLIFGWNALQGILEATIAWFIAFKFKFIDKYGIW